MTEQLLEKAHERIQIICEKIKTSTLDPAKEEASQIIEDAKKEADRIREGARKEAEKIQKEQKAAFLEEQKLFSSALEQASKQSFTLLKQKVESALFNPALDKWLQSQLESPKDTARLVDVLVQAIEKEGLKTDLEAKIPASMKAEAVLSQLSKNVAIQLQEKCIEVPDMKGGAKVSLKAKHMTLDLSDTALKELMASFIAKEFRKTFFAQ